MKHQATCIIVDDDPYAIDILTEYIAGISNLELRSTYTDPIKALSEMLADEPVDLLFLDIDMPGGSGLQLAEELRNKAPNIIFTTAHTQYAVEAFKVHPKHYLLKPIDQVEFVTATAEIISTIQIRSRQGKEDKPFYVRTGDRNVRTRIDKPDIILIESLANYVKIITLSHVYVVYMTIKELSEILKDEGDFFQVRKSAIVNALHTVKINGNTIYQGDRHTVQMTEHYKGPFMAYIDNRTLLSGRI